MKKKFLVQFLSLLLIISCKKTTEETFCNNFPLEKATLHDTLDYEIINTVLTYYYPNSKFIHLVQETDTSWRRGVDYVKEKLIYENVEYDNSLISSYSAKNETSYYLSDSLLRNSVQLINPKEINCFFSYDESGWDKYYKKYPESSGFIFFTRPGINSQGNKAVIEYGWLFDSLGGMGYIIILEKNNNSWTVTNRFYTWAV